MKIISILLLLFTLGCQESDKVVIGYQLMANPWKYLIASGKINQLAGKKVEFKKFDSGAKVINAMASGSVDIAVAGSTPIAAGMSQGLDAKLVRVLEVIGDAEALVVKEDINSFKDLVGKKIGVPFGSTTHFHLLASLKQNNIKMSDVKVLNLSPPAIVSSWKNNQIDAAFIWAPALIELKQDGKVLLSSKELAETGLPTFDGLIARSEFLKKNQKVVTELLNQIDSLYVDYNKSPWTAISPQVDVISKFIGLEKEKVLESLAGYVFQAKEDQGLDSLGKILKETAVFLKEQGKTEKVLDNYQDKVIKVN